MAYSPVDLGNVLRTAEAIKGARQQAVTAQLQQQYLGQQIQNNQDSAATNQTLGQQRVQAGQQELDANTAKQRFLAATAIAHSDDPIGAVNQFAPEMKQMFEQQNGPGSFDQLQPEQVKAMALHAAPLFAAHAGIQPPGNPTASNVGGFNVLQQDGKVIASKSQDPTADSDLKLRQDQLAETQRHNKAIEANKGGIYGNAPLSDDQKEFAYQNYVATGAIPTGMSPRGDAGKAALWGYISQRAGEDGNSAAQLAANRQTFQARQQAVKSYASGGKNNNTMQAISTAVAHMDTVLELGQALNNGDNQTVNRIKNAWKTEFGSEAPGNLSAAAQIVGNEVVKAVVQNGGSKEERDAAAAAFSDIKSFNQLQGVVNTYTQLLGGQVETKRNDYESGTGNKDFNTRFLTARARKALGVAELGQATPPGPPPAAPPQGAQQPVTATGPNGQKLMLQNGAWVPVNGQ